MKKPRSIESSAHESWMKVRLSTILWLQAILASAIATFQSVEEYVCAIAFLGIWLTVVYKTIRRSRIELLEVISYLAVLVCVSALCCRVIARSYEPERVSLCRNKVTEIAEALLKYKARHKVLPVARGKEGDNSVQSWRVVILPYLADQERLARVAGEPEELGYCMANDVYSGSLYGSSASFFAVKGPQTAWATLQSKQGQITDNPAETILLLEELDRGFNWDDPRDLDFYDALELLSKPVGSRYVHLGSGRSGYFEKQNPNRNHEGVNAVFADGSVRFIPVPLSEEFATALLTAHGGEKISKADMQTLWRSELDYEKIFSFGVFALCCFFPGLQLFRRTG